MMIEKYKIGLSTTLDYTIDIKSQIRMFADKGLDFISIGADIDHCRIYDSAYFGSILDLCKNLGIIIDSLHIPFGVEYDIAEADPELRKRAVERVVDFIGIVNKYKIPTVILHPHHWLLRICRGRTVHGYAGNY
jgi:hypothetical protein